MFEKVKTNLEARGYTVRCFDTAAQAVDYLDGQIRGVSVGFGGSMTLKELGLYERLSQNNQVYWHWCIPEGSTSRQICRKAASATVYLSSVNALAESGEIINIDGACNRVSAMLWGHERVYFVVGKNKLSEDAREALWRARNVAAPRNARRLGMKTPCAMGEERCHDCKSPERICRALSVLWEKPLGGDYEVILVNEELGY